MKGERNTDRIKRAEQTRFKVAYLKINSGLSLKEIADRLGVPNGTIAFHWEMARRIIMGSNSGRRSVRF